MPASRNIWIVKGYEMVAIDGFDNLKIERLAKAVGKPKSSFYFLFIDLENFTKQMIEFHLNQIFVCVNRWIFIRLGGDSMDVGSIGL